MAISPGGYEIQPPKIQEVPRYGLLSTIEPTILKDLHAFAGGVWWRDYLCTHAETFIDRCPPEQFIKSKEKDLKFCFADPFVVKGSFTCSPVGFTPAEAFEIARKRLLAWESFEVEKTLWTGVTADGTVNPSFAFGNDTCGITPVDLSSGGPLSVTAAVSVLEAALTSVVPGGGVIFAPYSANAFFANARLLRHCGECGDPGDKYYTPSGFPIVFGAGFPGTGIANAPAAPHTTTLFATGPIAVWSSNVMMVPDELAQGFARVSNDITVFAERFYAFGFSCALYKVTVNLEQD